MTLARLVKKATADGLYEFNDDVPVGRLYNVDVQHPMTAELFNVDKHVRHTKVLVKDLAQPGWLPLECLAVES